LCATNNVDKTPPLGVIILNLKELIMGGKSKKGAPKKQSAVVVIITVIYTIAMAFYAIYGLI
jgi:hypothetical protein